MKKLKIAFVGSNFGWNVWHKEFSKTGSNDFFDFVKMCDRDKVLLDRLFKDKDVKYCLNMDELLEDDSIDAIGLFTGPNGRADLIYKIMKAGKHVMTTKPFEMVPAKAAWILDEAEKMGKVLHMNSPAPENAPHINQILKWQKEFDLGPVVGGQSSMWAMKGDRGEEADGKWYDDPELCPVAPVYRLGIYPLNELLKIYGKAKRVNVMQSRIFTRRPTSDVGNLNIQFENGALLNVYVSFCVSDGDDHKASFILNFEKGTVYRQLGNMDRHSLILHYTKELGGPGFSETWKEERSKWAYQWNNFYKAIQGESIPADTSKEHIVEAIKIIDAMKRAQASGKTEEV